MLNFVKIFALLLFPMEAPDTSLVVKPAQTARNERIAESLKAKIEARRRYQEAVAAYYDAIREENLKS